MMTLEEIGQLLGVTRERVRQIEAKALRKLRPPNFGTEDWMNMDSSEKLEAMMRWRGGCAKITRFDVGATLVDVNSAIKLQQGLPGTILNHSHWIGSRRRAMV